MNRILGDQELKGSQRKPERLNARYKNKPTKFQRFGNRQPSTKTTYASSESQLDVLQLNRIVTGQQKNNKYRQNTKSLILLKLR